MTDVIIFTRANGQVTRRNLPENATSADFDRQIADAISTGKAIDQPVRFDNAQAPHYGSFRDAWVRQGNLLVVDMVKARDIKTTQIREERDRRLLQADDDLKITQDDNDGPREASVRSRRTALRDLPVTIQPVLDAITDPTGLDAYEPVWPE